MLNIPMNLLEEHTKKRRLRIFYVKYVQAEYLKAHPEDAESECEDEYKDDDTLEDEKVYKDIYGQLNKYFNMPKLLTDFIDSFKQTNTPRNVPRSQPTKIQDTYVYLITYPNDIVKVGRHSGAIKGLLGRYNTHTPTYKIEYFKCLDYINTEKAIHNTLKSQGLHEHLEFFKDTPPNSYGMEHVQGDEYEINFTVTPFNSPFTIMNNYDCK